MNQKEFAALIDKAGVLSVEVKTKQDELKSLTGKIKEYSFTFGGAGKYKGSKFVATVSDVNVPNEINPLKLFVACQKKRMETAFWNSVKVSITQAKENIGAEILGFLKYTPDECSKVSFAKIKKG